jgi:hypothetical protein
MADYTIPNKKIGQKLKPITITSDKSLTGATVCANFMTDYRSPVIFSLNWTIAVDGLSATSDELILDFPPASYFSDFTITYADGDVVHIGKYNLTLERTSC